MPQKHGFRAPSSHCSWVVYRVAVGAEYGDASAFDIGERGASYAQRRLTQHFRGRVWLCQVICRSYRASAAMDAHT